MTQNPYSTTDNANPGFEDKSKVQTKTIKRFDPLQLGKVSAVLYGLISLIFVPFLIIAALVAPKGNGLGMGVGLIIALPIIYAIFGFIAGVIGGLIYNLVSKIVGGIKVEVE